MAWYNPWSTNHRLANDLAEALTANKSYHAEALRHAVDITVLRGDINNLNDRIFMLRAENGRLESLLDRAVFRDSETGRVLPHGKRN